jgi:hypothetical protein
MTIDVALLTMPPATPENVPLNLGVTSETVKVEEPTELPACHIVALPVVSTVSNNIPAWAPPYVPTSGGKAMRMEVDPEGAAWTETTEVEPKVSGMADGTCDHTKGFPSIVALT